MDKVTRIDAGWKTVKVDNREILTKPYVVEGLDEALELSKIIVPIIEAHNQTEQTQISLSSRDVMVVLNGSSEEPISDKIQIIASEIDSAVKQLYQQN